MTPFNENRKLFNVLDILEPAALRMKIEDQRAKGAGWQIQLHENGGKQHAMPCHHALAEALRA
jgi:DNA-binding IclR family transcriptional regulator